MSAHGISPAWRAGGTGVPGPALILGYHTLQTLCELDLIGDVTAEITIGLGCTIDDGNINNLKIMTAGCTIATLGDVNPSISIDLFCVVTASGP